MSKADRQPPMVLRQGIHCFGKILLYTLLVAGFLTVFPHTATAQTITKIQPVTQPDTILPITFSQRITPTSIKIGADDATLVSQAPCDTCEIKVPARITPGRQAITIVAEGVEKPITGTVKVAPLILGLTPNTKTQPEFSRVVVAGGEVLLQFSEKIPAEIREGLKVTLVRNKREPAQSAQTTDQAAKPTPQQATQPSPEQAANTEPDTVPISAVPDDTYLVLKIPTDTGIQTTTYSVQVLAEGVALQRETRLQVRDVRSLYLRATVMIAGIIILIYLFYKVPVWSMYLRRIWRRKKQLQPEPEGQERPRHSFLKMLLLEQENQTYSLSRAQFFAWLMVIAWAYLFLYYVHGYVEGKWSFPVFGNAIYAFLISLGTLLAAQATSLGLGAKGAGQEHPSLADLVVHGGVLALDRVQQVVWTLIALGMFIRITVSTYETATALPEIQPELLTLMGLSAAGYLGGKLVRGPGPVIDQVIPAESNGKVVLSIKGKHLSKAAFVWLDGVQQPKDKVAPNGDDPDKPLEFAKALDLTLDMTLVNWRATEHAITVINPDAQRADWHTLPQIIKVTPAPPVNNKVTLTIDTEHAVKGASVNVPGATTDSVKQDETNPNLFTAVVDPTWQTTPHELTLMSNGRSSKFPFNPA